MFASSTFQLENRSAVYQALQRMKLGKADFSDYLIGAIAYQAQCFNTYSFDRKLLGEKGFQYPSTSGHTITDSDPGEKLIAL